VGEGVGSFLGTRGTRDDECGAGVAAINAAAEWACVRGAEQLEGKWVQNCVGHRLNVRTSVFPESPGARRTFRF
jgi:hypothetical protein